MSTPAMPPPRSGQEECPVYCTQRLTFWIVAASSWVVWIFAVAAAADDKWLSDNGEGDWMAPADDSVLEFCDEVDDVDAFGSSNEEDYGEICDIYKGFTAMQILGTIACSVAVVLLSLAFFRPAQGGCGSARTLVFVGGALVSTYALFQLLALSLVGAIKEKLNNIANPSEDGTFFTTYNDYFTFSEPGYDADVGPSFAVAISGLFLAIAVAILLCLFARHAGEGPLYSCCSSLMLANRTAGGTHKVEGGDRSSAPAPSQHIPTATAMGTAAAPAATAEPQHHYEEAGLPPPPQPASGPAEGERKQQEELPAYDALPPAKS